MTHKKLLVACLKVNGKVLREADETVSLPFGAEYSVLVKNLDSKRIQIAVSIDGQDAAGRLIIGPNQELELERFVKNGNLTAGNKFKFIERTGAIEQHRGVGAEDGLVRVEAWTEVPAPQYVWPTIHHYYLDPIPGVTLGGQHTNSVKRSRIAGSSATLGGTVTSSSTGINYVQNEMSATCDSMDGAQLDCAFHSDAGITVPGSESNQRFVMVSNFPCEAQSTVIVLKLRGVVGNQVVRQPVTVQAKPKCVTCGRQNKGGAKFCSQCGTALVIL